MVGAGGGSRGMLQSTRDEVMKWRSSNQVNLEKKNNIDRVSCSSEFKFTTKNWNRRRSAEEMFDLH